MTGRATLLLASLFLTHFLGDFTPLSTRRMREAKAHGKPVGPIAAHAGVHAFLLAVAVVLVFSPGIGLVAVAAGVEFVTHLAIDWGRGRAGAARPLLSDPEFQPFWTFLGLDQLAHYLVLLWIAQIVL